MESNKIKFRVMTAMLTEEYSPIVDSEARKPSLRKNSLLNQNSLNTNVHDEDCSTWSIASLPQKYFSRHELIVNLQRKSFIWDARKVFASKHLRCEVLFLKCSVTIGHSTIKQSYVDNVDCMAGAKYTNKTNPIIWEIAFAIYLNRHDIACWLFLCNKDPILLILLQPNHWPFMFVLDRANQRTIGITHNANQQISFTVPRQPLSPH